MYYTGRRPLSQHSLRNPQLIKKLVGRASFGQKDTIIEIGAGTGNITLELLRTGAKVMAVEIDRNLYQILLKKLQYFKNLVLYNEDFLAFKLPKFSYKVFANVPFVITSDIIRKLTNDSNMNEAYLIIQKEAAYKFIGRPYADKNPMVSMLLRPWFEMDILWKFQRSDFIPEPRVDSVLLRIKKNQNTAVKLENKDLYTSYVVYEYSRKKVANLNFESWVKNFEEFKRITSLKRKSYIRRRAKSFLESQKKIKKIHRTRNDRNWRKFR